MAAWGPTLWRPGDPHCGGLGTHSVVVWGPTLWWSGDRGSVSKRSIMKEVLRKFRGNQEDYEGRKIVCS